MLKTRVKTGAWLFIAVCLMLALSHIQWVLNLSIAFLCLFSIWEMTLALGSRDRNAPMIWGAILLGVLMTIPLQLYQWLLLVLFVTMVIFFSILMRGVGRIEDLKQSEKYLILFSIPVFFSAIRYIRLEPDGLLELTIAILVCTITDSFAYLVGRKFGRRKLAPTISPSKTIEGSVGGTLVTAAFLLLAAFGLSASGTMEISYLKLGVYLVTASFVGQFGDLCMSAVKRIEGIKDYSELLPGHGGVLDRFDSQLFVLPYTYLFCIFCGTIF